MTVEGEGLFDPFIPADDEGDGIYEAQVALAERKKEVEGFLMKLLIDPDHRQKRLEILTKGPGCCKTNAMSKKGIGLEENVRCRQKLATPLSESREGPTG